MKYCFTTIVEPKLKRYTDVTQQTNVAVDMGSIALFCRGSALCGLSLIHSDAADEEDSVDLGGRRIIKKKKKKKKNIS